MGSVLILSILLWAEKGICHFQNPNFQAAFLKSWKCFIPRRDSAKAEPNGVHLIFFPFYWVKERVLTLSKSHLSGGIFEILKMFIPRRDSAEQSPMGSIWYSHHFIVFRGGRVMFQISHGYVTFLISRLFCIPLNRDSAKQNPSGPFDVDPFYYGVE